MLLTTSAAIGLLLLIAGLCARHRARTAHADVVRSVVRAAGDRRAGAALSDLADPRRHAGAAAMARYRRSQRQGAALGRRCSAACCWRFPASWCWRCSTPAGSSATRKTRRSSIGRRSIRWRAISSISSPSRPALAGSLIAGLFNLDRGRRRRRHRAADVGAGRDRRDRRSHSTAAAAPAALGLGAGRHCARAGGCIAVTLFLPWTGSAEVSTVDAGRARSRISSATVLSGAPISGCARWPAIRNWRG